MMQLNLQKTHQGGPPHQKQLEKSQQHGHSPQMPCGMFVDSSAWQETDPSRTDSALAEGTTEMSSSLKEALHPQLLWGVQYPHSLVLDMFPVICSSL